MKIVNASKEEVLSILLAGDIIVINDSECYFDKQKDIYIFKRQDKIFYFKTLFDLSCFIAFNSSNIKVKGEKKNMMYKDPAKEILVLSEKTQKVLLEWLKTKKTFYDFTSCGTESVESIK